MSNFYSWHDERMNELKIKEISREIEHLHLLKEAELSEPGILSRAARAFGRWLKGQSQGRHDRPTAKRPSYSTGDDRSGS